MRFIYPIFIHFYGILLRFASFFNEKAKKWTLGRKNWEEILSKKINKNEKYCWIHCASAGEFEQAIPLIREIRDKRRETRDEIKIAVSFFSPSGFEMYKDSKLADVFFYFPLDTTRNVAKLIEILQPKFVLFIRNEIWLNTLHFLNKKEIPTFLVNANLVQERNYFYKIFLKKTYPLFTKIFDIDTYGNTKLESVIENKNEIFSDVVLEGFCKNSIVIILGSSWQIEEEFIATFYKKFKTEFPALKIIVAPHEYNNNKVNILEDLFDEKISCYTKLQTQNISNKILFLNKKGILKYAYRYADIAIIGGGFGKGVHNISEAAVYGIPTIFGNNFHKFEEVKTLINMQVAFTVNDYVAFENKLVELLINEEERIVQKNKLAEYYNQQKSTSDKIVKEVFEIVENKK